MVAAIYVRVSTDEQAEHGYSIDAQKERLIAFCKSQGWDEYRLYIDDGYTGTNTNRPALKRLIRHIEEKKVHAVVVYKLDRLSRKQKDVLALIEDVFEKNNVSFTSSSEKFDTSTAFGKAMIGVLAVFAQLERDMIVERTTTGRRQKLSKGIWSGGKIPFGYVWNKDAQVMEIVPEEARIIKEIFKRYLQGYSRLSIAEWAADRVSSRTIDHSTIRDMISRPAYAGDLVSGDAAYMNSHEPIIDRETWEAAQRETERRKKGTSPMGEYLLSGFLRCGVCGGNVVHVIRKTTKKNKSYEYHLYACQDQHVRKKDRTNNCSLGYVRRKVIEDYVINEIKSFNLFPAKISSTIKNDGKERPDLTMKENIKSQISKIETELENLYDAIQSGSIKASSVSSRISKLEEQKETLETNLDDIEISNGESVISRKEFKEIIDSAKLAWDYLTEDEQKAAIRTLVKSITLNKNDVPKIEWAYE